MVAWQTWTLMAGAAAGLFLLVAAGLRAQAAFSLTQAKSLRRFRDGLSLLALSQLFAILLEGLNQTAPDAIDRSGFDAFDLGFWGYYATLVGGLVFVFQSFGRHPFRWAPAMAPLLLVAGPLLQFLVVILLFFVVLHSGLNHLARKAGGSIQTSIGFFFLMLGHIGNLTDYAPLQPRLWWTELLILAGTLLLWLAIARPRRAADA